MKKLKYKLSLLVRKITPKLYIKQKYQKVFHKKLDLKDPRGFNEKILWLILYWQNPLIVKCADKYEIREYVREKLGNENILPNLYGVYNTINEIKWEKLPEKFAIKCTHGCKMNIICTNKSKLDINKACEKLRVWMKRDYGSAVYEPHYSHMTHRIISEEYIETSAGELPDDYKIYCFNGQPRCILVCMERKSGGLRLEWYDLEWNILDVGAEINEKRAKKPECLQEMLEYAKILSEPFPYVRVDFYDRHGEPILGEMTFTPYYGMAPYYSDEGNLLLGNMLQLPEKYKKHFK